MSTVPFRKILETAGSLDTKAWVYLPQTEAWELGSPAAVLRSEEVPPEREDEPDAGVPQAAKDAGLMQALPVEVVQQIVHNAHEQKPGADATTLLKAFLYYYDNDAFLSLS